MALQKPCISRPVEGRSARAAVQPFVPKTTNGPVELPEGPVVRRPTVVLVMTPQLGVEDCPLALQLVVPMLATPHSSRFERSPQAFLHRLEVDRELASAARRGSGASRDFGPAKTSWRIEDPQAAKQKCLISSRFPPLTRVPLSASAAERRLLSADAPEPFVICSANSCDHNSLIPHSLILQDASFGGKGTSPSGRGGDLAALAHTRRAEREARRQRRPRASGADPDRERGAGAVVRDEGEGVCDGSARARAGTCRLT